jgi:hypothetical protein
MFVKILAFVFMAALFAGAYYLPKDDAQRSINLPRKHRKLPKGELKVAPENPVELGRVHWMRDLDKGLAEGQAKGKPVLILFQEVPGCANCTRYGSTALSHPLIVEAIETYFVPVCIYNNKGGADAAALMRFDEPAWNNPVVRIVRADGATDVVPRLAEFRSQAQLVNGLRRALDLTGTAVPHYLELLEEELTAREAGVQTATFSMHCFWSGEGLFGNLPGVVETEAGFQDGREVVRVEYNPARVSKPELEKRTQGDGMQACSSNDGFRADREPKYYLSKTPYRFVPMTSLQACRANRLIGQRESPESVLSPRQMALYEFIRNNNGRAWKNAIGQEDMVQAWASAEKVWGKSVAK